MTRTTFRLAAIVLALSLSQASAQVIFSDNFESGNLNNWTATSATTPSPLTIDSTQNIEPAGGTFSALMDTSADRMHHNLLGDNGGSEITGASTFTSWIFDNSGTASRAFNEIRGYAGGTGLPNGGTAASGTLAQLLAIGKYNTVTRPGEVFDATKYQARLTFGSDASQVGWFNLNAVGAPNRSTGWHRFDIERLADETTINFYVDGVLGRTVTGATNVSWDTLILGPGLGTTAGNAWIDGMSVNFGAAIPEPGSFAFALLAAGLATQIRRRRVAA